MAILFLVLLLAASASADSVGRIIGGSDANENSHPYQLSLQVHSRGQWWHTCGAVLVDTKWAITAAHCTKGRSANSLRLVLNEHHLQQDSTNEIVYGITNIAEHEQYTDNSNVFPTQGAYPNDVAVLKLSEAAPETNVVRMANTDEKFDNMVCTISGWGLTESGGSVSDVLQEVDITVLTQDKCKETWTNYINDGHICVHDPAKSACNGDSGGPLTCVVNGEKVVAGLASWVYAGCQDNSGNTYPSAYARVSYFRSWFDSKMVE